jgi:hypothetical protein
MSKFPLIDELGLEIYRPFLHDPEICMVSASDLEDLLAKGVRVYCEMDPSGKIPLYMSHYGASYATHTFLSVGLKPLAKPDTAESLLREMIRLSKFGARDELDAVAKRAQEYLDKKT